MALNIEKNLSSHVFYPLAALISLSILITIFNVDQITADYFYALQSHSWAWKNSWLAEHFFHRGGRNLSIALGITCIVLLFIIDYRKTHTQNRKPLIYLVTTITGSSLIISILKALLSVSCPWEFSRYGGTLHYHKVIEQLFLHNGSGCFPAGQASAGYAWVALYFVGCHYQSQLRWLGLALALVAGLILGVAQQIRGAHFLSHDLWTLGVCWFFALFIYCVMFKEQTSSFSWRTA